MENMKTFDLMSVTAFGVYLTFRLRITTVNGERHDLSFKTTSYPVFHIVRGVITMRWSDLSLAQ